MHGHNNPVFCALKRWVALYIAKYSNRVSGEQDPRQRMQLEKSPNACLRNVTGPMWLAWRVRGRRAGKQRGHRSDVGGAW